jgi:hypothetical protein
MLYPGERSLRAMERSAAEEELRRRGPRAVLAELEWLQRHHGRRPGWVFYAFRDLFGYKPPDARPEPVPTADHLLEFWTKTRKRSNKRKPRRVA